MMRSAADLIAPAGVREDQPAFSGAEGVLSHGNLTRLACAYAQGLAKIGVKPGDRVAMLSETCLDAIVALFGAHQLGAIHVPINTRYRARELEHIIVDSGAQWIAVDAQGVGILASHPTLRERVRLIGLFDAPPNAVDTTLADLVRAPVADPRVPSDAEAALLIYTSGTTGPSKGAVITYGNIIAAIGALTDLWEWNACDRLSLALPLFHVHGLAIGVYGTVLHRGHALLHRHFSPAAIVHDFAEREATIFMGVPTMYSSLVEHLGQHPEDAAHLHKGRLFTAGSAALSPELFSRFESLCGHRVLERYGMTETLISLSNPYRGERRPGSVGLPVPGYALRVVADSGRECEANEAGELWVRGAGVMPRYWQRPDADSESFYDGWFRTGDVVIRQPDGYIRIVGRLSTDIVKSGGFKISTREIEEALPVFSDLAESTVVGLPHPHWGQILALACAPRCEWNDARAREVLHESAAAIAAQLADFKKPRAIIVLPYLPRNALGKVQKNEIISLATSGQAAVYLQNNGS
jgi:malonyl-CoA/methylmalonyl-CoA synthetase